MTSAIHRSPRRHAPCAPMFARRSRSAAQLRQADRRRLRAAGRDEYAGCTGAPSSMRLVIAASSRASSPSSKQLGIVEYRIGQAVQAARDDRYAVTDDQTSSYSSQGWGVRQHCERRAANERLDAGLDTYSGRTRMGGRGGTRDPPHPTPRASRPAPRRTSETRRTSVLRALRRFVPCHTLERELVELEVVRGRGPRATDVRLCHPVETCVGGAD